MKKRYNGVFVDPDFDEDEEIKGYYLYIPSERIRKWYPSLEAVNKAVRLAATTSKTIRDLLTL